MAILRGVHPVNAAPGLWRVATTATWRPKAPRSERPRTATCACDVAASYTAMIESNEPGISASTDATIMTSNPPCVAVNNAPANAPDAQAELTPLSVQQVATKCYRCYDYCCEEPSNHPAGASQPVSRRTSGGGGGTNYCCDAQWHTGRGTAADSAAPLRTSGHDRRRCGSRTSSRCQSLPCRPRCRDQTVHQ